MIELEPLLGPDMGPDAVTLDVRVFPKSGPPRWVVESHFRRPWHLKTWPRIRLRSHIIYRLLWILSFFGIRMPSRRLNLLADPASLYVKLRDKCDAISVFVGTPGPNRKIVVFIQRQKSAHFLKIPAGPSSFALVENEAKALDELSRDPNLKPLIPKHSYIEGHLALENIETALVSYSTLSNEELSRVSGLMEARGLFTEPLHHLCSRLDVLTDREASGPRTDSQKRIDLLRSKALAYWDTFPPNQTVSMYNAHGDFTRWNVFVASDGTARIIDWEMYAAKPRYFDLIHYNVSHQILVERSTPKRIINGLKKLEKNLELSNFWWEYVGHYFSVQSLIYASIFDKQLELHEQAPMQMDIWSTILDALTEERSSRDSEKMDVS